MILLSWAGEAGEAGEIFRILSDTKSDCFNGAGENGETGETVLVHQ